MGLFSWLFGKDEEEDVPPEPLVLGAKLQCDYGSENSYLIVQAQDIDINSLPGACVLDRKEESNILSFGVCCLELPAGR